MWHQDIFQPRCKKRSCKEGTVKFQHRCGLQKRSMPIFTLVAGCDMQQHTDVRFSSAKTKGDDSVSHGYKAQYRYSTISAQWKIAIIKWAANTHLWIKTDSNRGCCFVFFWLINAHKFTLSVWGQRSEEYPEFCLFFGQYGSEETAIWL